MSRIRLDIDRLVLNGFQPLEAKALTAALQSQLFLVLAESRTSHEWAQSHRTPVLKLGRMAISPGGTGARIVGAQLASRIGRGLKP